MSLPRPDLYPLFNTTSLLSFTFWESEVETQYIMHARQMLYHQAAPLALPLSLMCTSLSTGLRALRSLMLQADALQGGAAASLCSWLCHPDICRCVENTGEERG